jgi:hypothetical protein
MKKLSTQVGMGLAVFALLGSPISAQMHRGGRAGNRGSATHQRGDNRGSGMHQRGNRQGITQAELARLSVEEQRKLAITAIELGLNDKTTRANHDHTTMSVEELAVHIQQREVLRQERAEKMHLFWLEAAKLGVGPYSAERKDQTIARIELQQERLDQQRRRLNTLS